MIDLRAYPNGTSVRIRSGAIGTMSQAGILYKIQLQSGPSFTVYADGKYRAGQQDINDVVEALSDVPSVNTYSKLLNKIKELESRVEELEKNNS
jgi:hypothetical protein